MGALLENIIVGNKEYTFVDSFDFNNEIINCYMGDEDYLFSVKKDTSEEFIKNPIIIEKIKVQEGLDKQDYYYSAQAFTPGFMAKDLERFDDDLLIKVKDYFVKLLNKSSISISEEQIMKRLSKINYYFGKVWDAGFYHPATNSVVISKDSKKKETIIHEMIHASGGILFNLSNFLGTGFKEGGTQLTTARLLGFLDAKGEQYINLLFNMFLNGGTYTMPSVLIRQMEYLLEESVSESMLLGDMSFFNHFSQKYGRGLYRFLNHRTTRIAKATRLQEHISDYYLETQRILYEKAFNLEIKNVCDLSTAKKYIDKLRGFEYMMGKIYDEEKGFNEKADGFVEYYEKKLLEIREILTKNNVPKQGVDNLLEYGKHQKIFFKNSYTFDNFLLSFGGLGCLIDYMVNNEIQINPEKIDFYIGTINNNNIDCIITYNGEPLYYLGYRGDSYISTVLGDDNLSNEYKTADSEGEIEKIPDGFKRTSTVGEIRCSKYLNKKVINDVFEYVNESIVQRKDENYKQNIT